MESFNCQILESDPLSDTIMQIISGAHNFKILEKAVEMGIFDDLETSVDPVPAERIAKKHGYNLDKITRLLDALCALKLINKTTNSRGKSLYHNVSGSSKYLTRSRKSTLVPLVMMESNMILPLMDKLPFMLKSDMSMNIMSMKDGVDTNKMPSVEKENNMNQANIKCHSLTKPNAGTNGMTGKSPSSNPSMAALEKQMKFLMCMESMAAPCVSPLVRAFDLSSCKTAVDLGGGSGALGVALAKKYEDMDVQILDLPNVVQIAKKINPSLPDNASFISKNFFEEELPKADLYILSHVLHDWEEEHINTLLTKLHKEIPAGSYMLICEKILNPLKDGPESAATNNLMMAMLSNGRERTEKEYRMLLSSHGFVDTTIKKIAGYNTYDAILTKKQCEQ